MLVKATYFNNLLHSCKWEIKTRVSIMVFWDTPVGRCCCFNYFLRYPQLGVEPQKTKDHLIKLMDQTQDITRPVCISCGRSQSAQGQRLMFFTRRFNRFGSRQLSYRRRQDQFLISLRQAIGLESNFAQCISTKVGSKKESSFYQTIFYI